MTAEVIRIATPDHPRHQKFEVYDVATAAEAIQATGAVLGEPDSAGNVPIEVAASRGARGVWHVEIECRVD